MDKKQPILQINFKWDRESTAYFISRLLTQINKKDIEFSFEAKKGSIKTTTFIWLAGVISSGIVYDSLKEGAKYVVFELLKITNRKAIKKGKYLNKPIILEDDKPIEIEWDTKKEMTEIKELGKNSGSLQIKIISDNEKEQVKKYIKQTNKDNLREIDKLIQNELNKRRD